VIYWVLPILILPYLFLLFDIFKYLKRIKIFRAQKDPLTYVSVVIACRNEQENLPGLLINLASQDYPFYQFEVIIVDDHSGDKTISAARCYEYHLNLKILVNEGTGKKHALKTGINAARGNLIVTTDADCAPSGSWLKTIASFYELQNPDLIICPVQLTSLKGFFGKFQELEFLSLQAITAGTASGKKAVMCNGANLAFKKDSWLNNEENLRFDIATGDDIFLLHSMKKKGSEILWLESPGSTIITESAPDLKAFLGQRKRWASKSAAYRDRYSILLGIVTFVTNAVLAGLLIASIFNHAFFNSFLLAFIIKSIPDFLMLMNVTKRYGRRKLMWWFLPSQVVYPFYVLIVTGFAMIARTHP
jgi:cellulose synthase/poly-beta-1,6-N-acetylglucosamine synthase-like glycosyltransferase